MALFDVSLTGGEDGKSAYQYAVAAGFEGTEEEFADALLNENIEAEKIVFDNSVSGMNSENVQSAIDEHIATKNNPHDVTKEQVGLGNVDNTSDADKPISTEQQNAIDNALSTSKSYTDTKIADLVGAAPETLNTLEEVAQAIEENEGVVEALNSAIGNKANQNDLEALQDVVDTKIGQDDLTGFMTSENPTGIGTFSMNRKADTTVGQYSTTLGYDNTASGNYSHAEGGSSKAEARYAHAEGNATFATGEASHSEGYNSTASGSNSHAEGTKTKASKDNAHAEGKDTTASGNQSHAEGDTTFATGTNSHAEGNVARANGLNSHAEGYYTTANGENQHVQGKFNAIDNNNTYAHIVGGGTSDAYADRKNIHTLDWEGNADFAGDVTATDSEGNKVSLVELANNSSPGSGDYLAIENPVGTGSLSMNRKEGSIVGEFSTTLGNNTTASGDYSHAEGDSTTAIGLSSHAEGYGKSIIITGVSGDANATTYTTTTFGWSNFFIGTVIEYNGVYAYILSRDSDNRTFTLNKTLSSTALDNVDVIGYPYGIAFGNYSHIEGSGNALGDYSHAEGNSTTASGRNSHAEGYNTTASGQTSHAEGHGSEAIGEISHAEGNSTIASSDYQHVQGRYNIEDANGTYAHIVGNGNNDARSNAHTLDWNGNAWFAGDVTATNSSGTLVSLINHTHDGRYYTESEIDTKLNAKANSSHGNHVPTKETANNARFLRNDNTWQTITPANIGAAAAHSHPYLPTAGGTVTGTLTASGGILISGASKLTNVMNMGDNKATDGNRYYINGNGTGRFNALKYTSASAYSSKRYKNNIDYKNNDYWHEALMNIKPCTFYYNNDDENTKRIGLIAEELVELIPELVGLDDENKPSSIEYANLTIPLISEIQRLNKIVEELQAKIDMLEK